ncbi:MAG: hypothetical protein Kow0025_21280 [Thermodesulfovibrionales bacterium]
MSKGMASILAGKGVSQDKISVIPIGFDGLQTYGRNVDLTRDIMLENGIAGKFVVLYTGTMGHIMDIPTILQAARITKDEPAIVYLFVGGGQNMERYKIQADRDGLHCVFAGQCPKADIPLYCQQADVGLYPLRDGAVVAALLGNKIFDYLGAGLPVIYSGPEGDAADLVRRSGGGICLQPGDSVGLASTLRELYANRVMLREFGRSARSFIEKHCMTKDLMGQFEYTLRNMLETTRLRKTLGGDQ